MKNKIVEPIENDYYEVPENVSFFEAVIFDWVAEHYGLNEAQDGSWCIPELAEHLESVLKSGKKYQQKHTVSYDL